jgi:hypothetical protein
MEIRSRGSMTYKLVKLGIWLGELCLLLMLYSATLLAPIPFGFTRVGIALFLLASSGGLAYFASSHVEHPAEGQNPSFMQVISKAPFVVWIVVVTIILLQLGDGLLTAHLASKR